MMRKFLMWTLLGTLPLSAQAATVAGSVVMVTGRSTATNPATGAIRALAKGDAVHSGEILSTSANTFLNIRYEDGGYTMLRPNSRFEIADYRFEGQAAAPVADAQPNASPAPQAAPALPSPAAPATARTVNTAVQTGPSRAFFRLLKGGFRAVSGVIGKTTRAEYRVNTPVATIGIRGTDYEVNLCDAACAADPAIKRALEQRARAQLDGQQLAAADDLVLADAGGPGTPSAEGSEVVHVNQGSIDYTHDGNPEPQIVGSGDTYVMLPDGEPVPLTSPPASTQTPDPTSSACN